MEIDNGHRTIRTDYCSTGLAHFRVLKDYTLYINHEHEIKIANNSQ